MMTPRKREGQVAPGISIIVPVLDEAAVIERCLEPLQPARQAGEVELLVVDGGSEDDTVSRADRLADRLLSAPRGRAAQLAAGARASRGELLLFLHADTRIGPEHLTALAALPRPVWGRFDVRLSGERFVFRLIERLMNLRSRLTGIATGDQAIFVSRDWLAAVGGVPPLPLMEDVRLSALLKRQGPPRCLGPPVLSSSRRWERQGVWRTVFLMWALRLAFFLGADPAALARRYRKAR